VQRGRVYELLAQLRTDGGGKHGYTVVLPLYKSVLEDPLPWLNDLVRAQRPQRLPVVLTIDEVRRVIDAVEEPSRADVSRLGDTGAMDKTAEVLARLREQRARLQGELAGVESAIAALEEMTREPEPAPAPAPAAPPAPPAPVFVMPPPPPPGPYKHSEFFEAVAHYLREAGEPKGARDIAQALLAGGYFTRSGNFPAVVRATLNRVMPEGPFGIRGKGDGLYWCEREPDPDAST
jgi:hypothetical protein